MAAAADPSCRYFQGITKRLVSDKWKTPALCDQAERHYIQFTREHKEIMKNYEPKTQRLDEFMYGLLVEKENYMELLEVVQLVMTFFCLT